MSKDHDEEMGMFGHHEAAYNAEKIIRNLLLIQDHYSSDPCADCLSKHWNLVMAYAEEGKTLDGAPHLLGMFTTVEGLANRHLKVITECAVGNVCSVKKPSDMQRMIQEVRTLRRALNQRIYGLEGDITHDITEEMTSAPSKMVTEEAEEHLYADQEHA